MGSTPQARRGRLQVFEQQRDRAGIESLWEFVGFRTLHVPNKIREIGGANLEGGMAQHDRRYLDWVRSLGCLICDRPSEAHHAGEHGFGRKAPDRTAIPLCWEHHREGKDSAHRIGKRFWEHHGLDRDRIITGLNEKYDIKIGSRAA
jgi:hypothetical protein